jgi:hypothetical protein
MTAESRSMQRRMNLQKGGKSCFALALQEDLPQCKSCPNLPGCRTESKALNEEILRRSKGTK